MISCPRCDGHGSVPHPQFPRRLGFTCPLCDGACEVVVEKALAYQLSWLCEEIDEAVESCDINRAAEARNESRVLLSTIGGMD